MSTQKIKSRQPVKRGRDSVCSFLVRVVVEVSLNIDERGSLVAGAAGQVAQ